MSSFEASGSERTRRPLQQIVRRLKQSFYFDLKAVHIFAAAIPTKPTPPRNKLMAPKGRKKLSLKYPFSSMY